MKKLLLTLTILSYSLQLLATAHAANSSSTDDILPDELETLLIEKQKELISIQQEKKQINIQIAQAVSKSEKISKDLQAQNALKADYQQDVTDAKEQLVEIAKELQSIELSS